MKEEDRALLTVGLKITSPKYSSGTLSQKEESINFKVTVNLGQTEESHSYIAKYPPQNYVNAH